MIDFEKAEKQFKKLVKEYDVKNGMIELKIRHTYEVVEKSKYIAKGLGLDEENIELAKLIALLHDIGRFEQIKNFESFDESNLEHAEFGVKVLFDKNLIREFIEDNEYDEIIKKAVYNHNKYKIEEGLTDIELLHCKIIRDADKLDNFRVKQYEKLKNIFPEVYNENIEYETISDKVYKSFLKCECIKIEDRKTFIDYWICVIAFIFDLNFKISIEYVKDKDYINIMIDRIEYKNEDTKNKIEDIRKCAQKYIVRGK